jgi:hypothetical protein
MVYSTLLLLSALLASSGPVTAATHDRDIITITAHGNDLSAHANGAPLKTVLSRLNHATGIRVSFPAQAGESRLWASFDALPLQEAIGKLLKGHSYILVDTIPSGRGSEIGRSVVPRLKVLASPGRESLGPYRYREVEIAAAPAQIPAPDRIVIFNDNPGLHDPDPGIRVAAIRGLVDSYGDAALPFVLALVTDPDYRVQLDALDLLERHGWSGNIPGYTLERLALHAGHAEVRTRSLQLLNTRHADSRVARDVSRRAKDGTGPAVREAISPPP